MAVVDKLKDEIKTRMDTIAELEREVEALQRTVDILRRSDREPEPDAPAPVKPPATEPRQRPTPAPTTPNDTQPPDPALVAIFNADTRIGGLRRIAAERGMVHLQDAALAFLNSDDEKKADDLAGCVKQLRQTLAAYTKEFRGNGDGTYSPKPQEPAPAPPPPKPTCPRDGCDGTLTEREVADSLGRREMVSQCRQCGHEVASDVAEAGGH